MKSRTVCQRPASVRLPALSAGVSAPHGTAAISLASGARRRSMAPETCGTAGPHAALPDRHRGGHGVPAQPGRHPWRPQGRQRAAQEHRLLPRLRLQGALRPAVLCCALLCGVRTQRPRSTPALCCHSTRGAKAAAWTRGAALWWTAVPVSAARRKARACQGVAPGRHRGSLLAARSHRRPATPCGGVTRAAAPRAAVRPGPEPPAHQRHAHPDQHVRHGRLPAGRAAARRQAVQGGGRVQLRDAGLGAVHRPAPLRRHPGQPGAAGPRSAGPGAGPAPARGCRARVRLPPPVTPPGVPRAGSAGKRLCTCLPGPARAAAAGLRARRPAGVSVCMAGLRGPRGAEGGAGAQIYFKALMGFRPVVPPDMHVGLRTLMEECWLADPERRPSFDSILARLRVRGCVLPCRGRGRLVRLHTACSADAAALLGPASPRRTPSGCSRSRRMHGALPRAPATPP